MSSSLLIQVESAVVGGKVLLIGTARHLQVAVGCHLAGRRVVGGMVGEDHIILIIDFHPASQIVGVAAAFLLAGVDRNRDAGGWRGDRFCNRQIFSRRLRRVWKIRVRCRGGVWRWVRVRVQLNSGWKLWARSTALSQWQAR